MTIEKKRNLLRISREHSQNINTQKNTNYNIPQVEKPDVLHLDYSVKRIRTSIKSKFLGKNLNPDYIGKYKGESFIITGCGSSVNLYEDLSKYFIIGVNDIERILVPDFLVVVNDFRTFMRGRWDFVRTSTSPVIFSHLDNPGPIDHPENLVKIKIGNNGFPNLDKMDAVDHTMNSPYMAAIIAYQLGAKKIGIIGVDFTENHFFSKTGIHKLSKHIKNIDNEYGILHEELKKRGVILANLSPISLLQTLPRMTLEQFNSI